MELDTLQDVDVTLLESKGIGIAAHIILVFEVLIFLSCNMDTYASS